MKLYEVYELAKQNPQWTTVLIVVLLKCVDITPIPINPLKWILEHPLKGVMNVLRAAGSHTIRGLGAIMLGEVYSKLDNVDSKLDDFETQFTSLKLEIDNIRDEQIRLEANRDMKDLKDDRWAILEFANSLTKRKRDKEEFEHIMYTVFVEYEELIEKYDLENGKTDRAMIKIRKYYDELEDKHVF